MTIFNNGFFPGELKPNTTVAGCIDIFENVWPTPAKTIELVEEQCSIADSGATWTKAATSNAGQHQDYRTNRLLSISELGMLYNNPVFQNIHNQYYMMLLAASIPYANRYNIGSSLFHEGYNLLKYSNGEEYKPHYDTSGTMNRIISAICYLNNDFQGGELEFPNFNLKIKPEPGMLILFPSSYPYMHIAHPVTQGNKYAIVTWIRDTPVPY
jgi:predicted 2-oxoglutarate/Fe(II)-dependent dioxygenase YbiX